MKIERDAYLRQLIDKKHNRMIKIISGIRRCGKSYLLFELFRQHLLDSGVKSDHIITLALDGLEERAYRDPEVCYQYVKSRLVDEQMHYLLLDEVQLMEDFESVLNGLLRIKHLDIYVTGSNSRFLSTDVVTEFRGRGDEIRVYPLSFAEFYSTKECYWEEAWNEYVLYGGMPLILSISDPREKMKYLSNLFRETYLRDMIDRNGLQKDEELEELISIIASGIGSLLNPNKLANIFASVKHVKIAPATITQYMTYLQNAFIISKAERFDIKGNRYINSPFKYYFVDPGLRNACLKFRQTEKSHLMENIIYNELCMRGFQVDVGMVKIDEKKKDTREQKRLEVDFVANMGDKRFYIQSALAMPTREKKEQEERSLHAIRDSFKKIIISHDALSPHYNERGVLIIPLKNFLLDPESISK